MLDTLYRINKETGNYIIDVALDDYLDFFHEWDNAAFKKRDMHPELAEFLDICSEDIPLKKQFEIHFSVENEAKDEVKERRILSSFKNNYELFQRVAKKKIKSHLAKAAILALISTAFLLVHNVLSTYIPATVYTKVLLEGLNIGGWVFMWEALHVITFQRQQHAVRYREIKRFLNAPITFTYRMEEHHS